MIRECAASIAGAGVWVKIVVQNDTGHRVTLDDIAHHSDDMFPNGWVSRIQPKQVSYAMDRAGELTTYMIASFVLRRVGSRSKRVDPGVDRNAPLAPNPDEIVKWIVAWRCALCTC